MHLIMELKELKSCIVSGFELNSSATFSLKVRLSIINRLIYKNQPGLRSLHPLVTSLMSRTNDWYSNVGRGKYTGLIFIDLKLALATMNQVILQKEL